MKSVRFACMFIMACPMLYGQRDTLSTYQLDEVVIENKMFQSVVGLDILSFDSVVLSNSEASTLQELARRNGFLEFRSYGTNGLSTPSIRGTGSAHTAVLWNGINLQSPLVGSADLSLVTVSAVDEIKIVKGGAAAQFGSGAIGGAIQINNKIAYNQGFIASTRQELGSFQNYYHNYRFGWSNRRFGFVAKIFARELKNDYPYINQYVRPEQKEIRENAALDQLGLSTSAEWRINDKNQLGVRVWLQSNEIELPNSILSSASNSSQTDETTRLMGYWKQVNRRHSLSAKTAYLFHKTIYNNPSTRLMATNQFNSLVNRLEYEKFISDNYSLILGINHRHDQSNISDFGGIKPSRNTISAFGSYLMEFDQLDISLSARQEFYDDQFSPFLPSLGVSYEFLPFLAVKGLCSINYRIPTFNDLYWKGEGGVGNPNLKAEYSKNLDIGLNYFKYDVLKAKVTLYSYQVDNWIIWLPLSSDEWSPNNVKKVWSRGLDSHVEGALVRKGNLKLAYQLNYLWSVATNTEIFSSGNSSEQDRQLIYTPEHSGSAQIGSQWHRFGSTLSWNYTGKQYTDGQNKELLSLNSYQVLNFSFSSSWKLNDHLNASTNLSVNNILDTQYENRRGYPMYGRNFSIGLTLNFNKNYD